MPKKIEGKKIKLIALAIIIHPFLILMFSALALVMPQGLADNTMFWNTTAGIVMFYGRYLSCTIFILAPIIPYLTPENRSNLHFIFKKFTAFIIVKIFNEIVPLISFFFW